MLRLLFTLVSLYLVCNHITVHAGKGTDLFEYPPAIDWVGDVSYEKFGASAAVYGDEYVIGTNNVQFVDGDPLQPTNSFGYIAVYGRNPGDGSYGKYPYYKYGTTNDTKPDSFSPNNEGFGSTVALTDKYIVTGNQNKADRAALIFSRDVDGKWPSDKYYMLQIRQNRYGVMANAEACGDFGCTAERNSCESTFVAAGSNCDTVGADAKTTCLGSGKSESECDDEAAAALAACGVTAQTTKDECLEQCGPFGDSSGPNVFVALDAYQTEDINGQQTKTCSDTYCSIGSSDDTYTRPGDDDAFGNTVSVWGDTVAIGANQYNGAQGAVYVYMEAVDVLQQDDSRMNAFPPGSPGNGGKPINRPAINSAEENVLRMNFWPVPYVILEGDQQVDDRTEHFGQSVSVSENYIAVGAPQAEGIKKRSGEFITHAGRVFIFGRTNSVGGWGKTAVTVLTGARDNGYFGYSVSMNDRAILVGEHQKQGIGAKETFEGEVSIWNYEVAESGGITVGAKLAILGDTAEGDFGRAVSLGETRFAVAGKTNKVWMYGTDVKGNWASDLLAVQTGEGTESNYGTAVVTGTDFVLSTAPGYEMKNAAGTIVVDAGKVHIYRIFEASALSVTFIVGVTIFVLAMMCFIGTFLRFYCAEAGDAKVIDPKLAAKAARLGFGHHNVGHKHVGHKHGEEAKEKKFLAPAGQNVTKAPTTFSSSNPLAVGNPMMDEVYGDDL